MPAVSSSSSSPSPLTTTTSTPTSNPTLAAYRGQSDFVQGGVASAVGQVGSFDPKRFQDGKVYKLSGGKWSEANASQVPPGSLVYVNGFRTNGEGAANSAADVSKNNGGKDLYLVYNANENPLNIAGNNLDPNSRSGTIDATKEIMKSTGGNLTLMAHSQGQSIIADAAYRYAGEDKGNLSNMKIYSWGGTASGSTVDSIAGKGAKVVNFVHQQKVHNEDAYVRGRKVTREVEDQGGDSWAANSPWGGNFVKVNTTTGQRSSNNSHNAGIDYPPGFNHDNTNMGHDYTGTHEIGNTRGM